MDSYNSWIHDVHGFIHSALVSHHRVHGFIDHRVHEFIGREFLIVAVMRFIDGLHRFMNSGFIIVRRDDHHGFIGYHSRFVGFMVHGVIVHSSKEISVHCSCNLSHSNSA